MLEMPKRWSGVGSTAALGGVVEEAPEVRGPELAGTHGGEGEAVGATARPWLPLQRVELRMRRIVVVEADLQTARTGSSSSRGGDTRGRAPRSGRRP